MPKTHIHTDPMIVTDVCIHVADYGFASVCVVFVCIAFVSNRGMLFGKAATEMFYMYLIQFLYAQMSI